MTTKDEGRKGLAGGRSRVLFHVVSVGRERRRTFGFLLLLAIVAGTAWYLVGEGVKEKGESLFVGRWLRWTTDATSEQFVSEPGTIPAVVESDDAAVPALGGVIVSVDPEPVSSPRRVHPFDVLRIERERQRSREIEMLETIVTDVTRTTDERDAASRRAESMWSDARREAEVEHLLEAQGYRVVATVSEGRAHIVVDAPLDASDAARIGELTVQVTGVRREAVTIVDAISSGG